MSEREYEGRCRSCRNRWYLRLFFMSSYVRVRCPRCGNPNAVAEELPPVEVAP